MSAFVFLDRDGTLNVDTGYVFRPDELELIPGASSGISRLKSAGFLLAVISNQSAIGRGYCEAADVEQTNHRLVEVLLESNSRAVIDAIEYCPHAPEENCRCRKPEPGLIERVAERFSFNAKQSWIIGDKQADIELGARVGVPAGQRILVLTGHGEEERRMLEAAGELSADSPVCVVQPSIVEAVDYILAS